MRHTLKTVRVRMELETYSHGRESAHVVEQAICEKCGANIGPERHYGYKPERLKQLENEHNLDEIFRLLESYQPVTRKEGAGD